MKPQQRKGFIVQADDELFNAIVEDSEGKLYVFFFGHKQNLQKIFQQAGIEEVDPPPPEEIQPWMTSIYDPNEPPYPENYGDDIDQPDGWTS